MSLSCVCVSVLFTYSNFTVTGCLTAKILMLEQRSEPGATLTFLKRERTLINLYFLFEIDEKGVINQ